MSKKASAVNNATNFDLIVVSDTMLQDPDVDSRAMGKAVDNIEAAAMLLVIGSAQGLVSNWDFYQGSWEFHLNEALVEIDQLSDETLVELVLNNSWVGKAGCYDLAGDMGKFASLVEGEKRQSWHCYLMRWLD